MVIWFYEIKIKYNSDICLQVRNLTALVNESQGFRLKGWFKPAVIETGVTQELFSIHVSYLGPNGSLTDTQKDSVYKDGNHEFVL